MARGVRGEVWAEARLGRVECYGVGRGDLGEVDVDGARGEDGGGQGGEEGDREENGSDEGRRSVHGCRAVSPKCSLYAVLLSKIPNAPRR